MSLLSPRALPFVNGGLSTSRSRPGPHAQGLATCLSQDFLQRGHLLLQQLKLVAGLGHAVSARRLLETRRRLKRSRSAKCAQ
jgi:hypothetical protein